MSTIQPKVMMLVKNLKSDLPQEELERRARERMPEFRKLDGLVQKYYSCDEQTGLWAGIYLWDSLESLKEFGESELRASIPSAYELTGPPVIEIFPIIDVLRS